jgi:hypothetical protein
MSTDINPFDCPEIRHYRREVIDGAVIVRYEIRQPGERDWTPVRLIRLV